MAFGIDYNYWSGMLGMAKFKEDFGIYDPSIGSYIVPTSWQSAGSGPPTAGLAFGTLLSLVGILIKATSFHSYWQIVAGRIIHSLALGVISNTAPAYQAECAPSRIRGTLVNFYQFSLGVGATLVNTANWGMHDRTDQWAYRMVIIPQFIIPITLGVGSLFIPESPRWLIGHGRDADARVVLKWLRQGTSEDLVDQEVQLLVAAEEQNRQHFSNSWIKCFKGSNLRRTLIVTGVQSWQKAQGNIFISSYGVVFLQAIGVQNTYQIQVLLVFTTAISCIFAFYFPDRIGRRWIMIGSSLLMAACMYPVAGITGFSHSTNTNAMKGALAALSIWKFTLATDWSSRVWIVTAETPTLQLREKTIMTGSFIGYFVSILITFMNPYMQNAGYGNLQGRVGFVYGSCSIAAAIWSFFLLPETGKRSLEELDELFERGVPALKFSKYRTSGFGA